MNLIIRERADLRDSKAEYEQDIQTADQWVQKALATKKEKAEQGIRPGGGYAPPPPPPPPPSGTVPVRLGISGDGIHPRLINQVPPVYPPLALQARIQGVVRFLATIDKNGRVAHLQVQSGHPLLVPPALEAAKQWVYEPTLLNGQPVEVNSQLDVNFVLPN